MSDGPNLLLFKRRKRVDHTESQKEVGKDKTREEKRKEKRHTPQP
jgi:hypothetical protein